MRPVARTRRCAAAVEALLRSHAQAGSFLERDVGVTTPTIELPLTERPGTVIGPYKLLQEIGEGGMGVVYMAEQEAAGRAAGGPEDHQAGHGHPRR